MLYYARKVTPNSDGLPNELSSINDSKSSGVEAWLKEHGDGDLADSDHESSVASSDADVASCRTAPAEPGSSRYDHACACTDTIRSHVS